MKTIRTSALILTAVLFAAHYAHADGKSLEIQGKIAPSLSISGETFFTATNQIPLLCGDTEFVRGNSTFQANEKDVDASVSLSNGSYRLSMSTTPPIGVCGWVYAGGQIVIGDASDPSKTGTTIFISISDAGGLAPPAVPGSSIPSSLSCQSNSNSVDCQPSDSISVPSGQLSLDLQASQ